MHKYFSVIMSALFAAVLVVGMLLITPHVAHAACSGSGCNGLDPHNAGCDAGAYPILSAGLVDEFGTTDGTLYLEWSPSCQTNWGRIVMKTNNTDPICVFLASNQCWYSLSARMFLLGFDSSGHFNGVETYLPLSHDGPDNCDQNCGGSTIFYGNMYYAPSAEVLVQGEAASEYQDKNGDLDVADACLYTGASWKYSTKKPNCYV
jgi:hypothetical protein